MTHEPCAPAVAQARDLLGDLTSAGTCRPCAWRGPERPTWHDADRDARRHAAGVRDAHETRERAAMARGAGACP